jgi:hypothetical protein
MFSKTILDHVWSQQDSYQIERNASNHSIINFVSSMRQLNEECLEFFKQHSSAGPLINIKNPYQH